ncbi:MAG TPA: hypothetical protein VGN86_07865, partial [Pyrinomonadaceae bacterium]|nr:hypothetical protein [Pyrinomonadaceae bacterium]
MKATHRCIDEKHHWSDSINEIPPKDLDEFLSHVDACRYHAQILAREDQELRVTLRPAHGLSPTGEILEGEELKRALRNNERRQVRWKEQTSKKELPFAYVALRNAGKEIARCGEFHEFQRHEAVHQLDPEAGLQIFGVLTGGTESETQLGFFPMVGVKLDGSESRIGLENDYVVCLRVVPRALRRYFVHFRCVSKKELAKPIETMWGRLVATAGTQIVSVALSLAISALFWFFCNPGLRLSEETTLLLEPVVGGVAGHSTAPTSATTSTGQAETRLTEVNVVGWDPIVPELVRTNSRTASKHAEHAALKQANETTTVGSDATAALSTQSFAFRALVGASAAQSFVILNVGADARFGDQIKEAMKDSPDFSTVINQATQQQMTISWRLLSADKSSTVEALLIVGNQAKRVYGVAEGDHADQSSQAALKSTLKQV